MPCKLYRKSEDKIRTYEDLPPRTFSVMMMKLEKAPAPTQVPTITWGKSPVAKGTVPATGPATGIIPVAGIFGRTTES
jgi:hypothetical protein